MCEFMSVLCKHECMCVYVADYGKLVQVKDLLEEEMQNMAPVSETVQFDFDPVNTW